VKSSNSLAASLAATPTRCNPAEERRLFEAVQEHLNALEDGRRPDRRALLADNPAIADELSACLQGLSFVQSASAAINRSSQKK
jgi:hypothetical protein